MEKNVESYTHTMSEGLGEDADVGVGKREGANTKGTDKKIQRGLKSTHNYNYHPHLVGSLYALDTALTRPPNLTLTSYLMKVLLIIPIFQIKKQI